jgi:Xaa-Pro aminopeptidase
VLGTGARTGLIGNPPAPVRAALATGGGPVVLDREYTRLRQVKSAEELACLRYAARLTDRSAAALVAAAVPGATELDLVAAVEASYAGTGATNHIHYVCSTSMQEPDRCVPGQLPTHRRVRSGSAVVFELSTAWGPEYAGQLLRTVLVDVDEPTPLYRDLHELAAQVHDAVVAALAPGASPADLVALAQPVLDAGLVTVDDLLHGFGGGYLPPVLSQRAAPTGMHAEPLAAGMTVVVQPNVATPDLRAGVQTGELYEITPTGARSLHDFPSGLVHAG